MIIALVVPLMSEGQSTDNAKTRDERDKVILNGLRKYAQADPNHDFAVACRTGDVRFIGMMGYGLSVPGVPNYEKVYAKSVGVKIIPGTTDAITNEQQRQLQDAVRFYAKKYNELVLDYLSTHKGKP